MCSSDLRDSGDRAGKADNAGTGGADSGSGKVSGCAVCLALTDRGMDVSNYVMAQFLL